MSQHYFEQAGGKWNIIESDVNSPDKILARSEPLHDDDVDCDADLAPEDDGTDISAANIKGIPRDALRHLLLFLIPATSPRKWRVAQLRLVVLAHLAGVEGIGDKSLSELARQLGVTRSLLSLYSVRMVDQLKQNQPRGGKRRETRETYRQSAIAYHRRAGHTMRAV